jgi:hypothetical protein
VRRIVLGQSEVEKRVCGKGLRKICIENITQWQQGPGKKYAFFTGADCFRRILGPGLVKENWMALINENETRSDNFVHPFFGKGPEISWAGLVTNKVILI